MPIRNDYVTVENGQSLPITHTGNSQLRTSSHLFHLHKVLHVPSMSSSLLSAYRFCKDNDASFHFDAFKFQIMDLRSGKLLYSDLSEHGLYPVCGAILPSSSSSSYAFSSTTSAQLWHTWLGHPQSRVFSHVLNKFLHVNFVSNKVPFCTHCVEGKHHQLPFTDSVSITSRPLELVHTDVWGPAPVISCNGTRYYVSFIDNFTRFTWFFPLKYKSQVLESFKHFKSTMENILDCKIKILRSDYGGEYSKYEFQSFCSSAEILHQFSCSHTS